MGGFATRWVAAQRDGLLRSEMGATHDGFAQFDSPVLMLYFTSCSPHHQRGSWGKVEADNSGIVVGAVWLARGSDGFHGWNNNKEKRVWRIADVLVCTSTRPGSPRRSKEKSWGGCFVLNPVLLSETWKLENLKTLNQSSQVHIITASYCLILMNPLAKLSSYRRGSRKVIDME